MAALYGEGHTTVPGLLIDGEPVHGSRPILDRLEALAPEPPLYLERIADAVREAERWGDEELQDLGRRLPWGALHFRPEALGTFGGAGPLDPAGTDFAIGWGARAGSTTGSRPSGLAEDLAGLLAKLDHVDALARTARSAARRPTPRTCRSARPRPAHVGDVRPLIEGRAGERIARRVVPGLPGDVPAGAFPAGWVPSR